MTAQGGNSAAEVGQVPRIPAYRNVANAFLILSLKLAALNCPLDKRGQLTFVCRLQCQSWHDRTEIPGRLLMEA